MEFIVSPFHIIRISKCWRTCRNYFPRPTNRHGHGSLLLISTTLLLVTKWLRKFVTPLHQASPPHLPPVPTAGVFWGQKLKQKRKNQDGGGKTHFCAISWSKWWRYPPFPFLQFARTSCEEWRPSHHLAWFGHHLLNLGQFSLTHPRGMPVCVVITHPHITLMFEGRIAMPRRNICWSWIANPGAVPPRLMCLFYVLVSTLAVCLCVCWSIISVCVCGPTMVGGVWTRSFCWKEKMPGRTIYIYISV